MHAPTLLLGFMLGVVLVFGWQFAVHTPHITHNHTLVGDRPTGSSADAAARATVKTAGGAASGGSVDRDLLARVEARVAELIAESNALLGRPNAPPRNATANATATATAPATSTPVTTGKPGMS